MAKKEKPVRKEDVTGVWTGFIVVTLVMIALCFFPFEGWQFWMIFPIVGTLIGAITTTIQFYTAGVVKCSNCGTKLDGEVEFCRVCGARVITKCPSCNTPLNKGAKFCEKCGFSITAPQKAAPNISASNVNININAQNAPNAQNINTQNPIKASSQPNAPIGSFCAACGAKISPGSKYCLTCGNLLN